MPSVDAKTEELRAAHDKLAAFYVDALAGVLDAMPVERAVLGLFCELSLTVGSEVGDIGDRATAFGELARVVKPGGYLVTAFKDGDGTLRRNGPSVALGVTFDRYWLSSEEMVSRFGDAGFSVVFRGARPAEEGEQTPQGYLLVRRG